MSAYWGYVCIEHSPPLESERWGNHGQEQLREIFNAHRTGTLAMTPEIHKHGPFKGQINYLRDYVPLPIHHRSETIVSVEPMHWLDQHPRCNVILRNEYGDREPMDRSCVGDTDGDGNCHQAMCFACHPEAWKRDTK